MEKINLLEVLRNCPEGMELDCTMYEDVYFDYVDELNIIHCYIQHETHKTAITFNQYGTYNSDIKSKCVIFPKGKTTWEGFHRPYLNGDIVYTAMDSIAILGNRIGEHSEGFHSYCGLYNYEFDTDVVVLPERLATEDEKQKLFQVIKDNGYRWNEETNTLEKLVEHRFKVGDRIRHKCPEFRGERIVTICCDTGYWTTINDWIDIEDQDDWELVPAEPKFKVGDKIFNVLRKSMGALGTFQGTISEITGDKYIFTDGSYMLISCQDNYELVPVEHQFKVGDTVRSKNCPKAGSFVIVGVKEDGYLVNLKNHYIKFKDQDNYELVQDKFDITSLKTFDQVLVRDFDNTPWEIEFFSRLLDGKHFKCSGLSYMQCIPYKGNEHLNGKKDDCDKYFKTWE